MNRPVFAFVLLALFLAAPAAASETPLRPTMRISVENTDRHVQTRFVRRFAEILAEAAEDRLDVRFHADARLYRDSDVIYALGRGRIEMAVPGTWHVSRAVPEVGVFLLPTFYGRPPELNRRLLAGPLGLALNERIEERLNVRIPGSWFDLGHAHLFAVGKPILRHEDIAGLRIRVAGGPANARRIEAFGGRPAVIPWPDLPAWLDRGAVDGVLTTPATVVSARLWERGVSSVFLDRQYFPQYVPMIARPFWDRLAPDLRETIVRIWEPLAEEQRAAAAEDQEEALRTLAAHGVRLFRPAPEVLELWRKRLLPFEDSMAEELGIHPDFHGPEFRARFVPETDRP